MNKRICYIADNEPRILQIEMLLVQYIPTRMKVT